MPPEEFRQLLRDSPNPVADSGDIREAYRYAKVGRAGQKPNRNPDDFAIVGEIRDAFSA